MSTVTVTTSADASVNDGSAVTVAVVNAGSFSAFIRRGPGPELLRKLRPGERATFTPEGLALTARGDDGATTLDVTATAASSTGPALPQSGFTGPVDLSGATLLKLPAASTTVAVFNVKVYGAAGDGTTDDTAAVQAAVDAAAAVTGSSSGGATVHFPTGTYKLTDVITLGASKLTIQGAGIKSTWIKQTGSNKHGFYATDKREFTFKDFALEGTSAGTGDGIYLAATSSYAVFDCRFENVYIEEFGRHGIHTEDLCTSLFNHVRVDACGTDGFHIGDNGGSGLGGTSLTFNSCYANGNSGSGYYIYALKYSNFNGCAADANNYSYQVVQSSGLAFNACGLEATAGSAGHGFFITNGSNSIVVNAGWTTNVKATTGIAYHVTANGGSNCSRIVFIGCKSQGGITPLASAKVDTNCQATFINHQPHPSVGFTGTGSMQFLSHDNLGLSSYGQAPASGDEPYLAWLPDTATFGYGTSVAADTVRRWAVRSDGKTEWGTGALTRDTNLYRSAADTLRTDDTFVAAAVNVGSPSSSARLYMTYADSATQSIGIYCIESAGSSNSTAMQIMEAAGASKRILDIKVTGDSSRRLSVLASGQITWGSGTALDTNLYRSAADVLATDDDLSLKTAGKGLQIKEGSNAKLGTATLVAGTVTISNTSVTSTSRIFLTTYNVGGTPGALYVSGKVAGTSFSVTSTSGTDTSTFNYLIVEPSV